MYVNVTAMYNVFSLFAIFLENKFNPLVVAWEAFVREESLVTVNVVHAYGIKL